MDQWYDQSFPHQWAQDIWQYLRKYVIDVIKHQKIHISLNHLGPYLITPEVRWVALHIMMITQQYLHHRLSLNDLCLTGIILARWRWHGSRCCPCVINRARVEIRSHANVHYDHSVMLWFLNRSLSHCIHSAIKLYGSLTIVPVTQGDYLQLCQGSATTIHSLLRIV